MNKLEQEIEERLKPIVTMGGNSITEEAFKAGAQFILEKNLGVEFAKWFVEHFTETVKGIQAKPYKQFDIFYREAEYTYEEIHEYWINNKYRL